MSDHHPTKHCGPQSRLSEAASEMARGFVALMKLARSMSESDIEELLPTLTEQCASSLKPLFEEIERLRARGDI